MSDLTSWPPERWQDRWFTGHIGFGPRWFHVVLFGANAMHWALNVRIWRWWFCFHPTTKTFGTRWPWYFYVSRDGTPPGIWGIGRYRHAE